MQAQRNRQKSEHVESQKSRPEAVFGDKRPVLSRLERQEARPEAVLDARRPVRTPSWPAGGPSGAVLDAKRPVRRPSWTPGGSSGGRLGRQEARPQAVLAVRRPECRFYCSFAAKCSVLRSLRAPRPQASLRNFELDFLGKGMFSLLRFSMFGEIWLLPIILFNCCLQQHQVKD